MNATAIVPQRPPRHADCPDRDNPQHMRALERANQVRLARAELKRKVAAADIDVADVILDCPWEAMRPTAGARARLSHRGRPTRWSAERAFSGAASPTRPPG